MITLEHQTSNNMEDLVQVHLKSDVSVSFLAVPDKDNENKLKMCSGLQDHVGGTSNNAERISPIVRASPSLRSEDDSFPSRTAASRTSFCWAILYILSSTVSFVTSLHIHLNIISARTIENRDRKY